MNSHEVFIHIHQGCFAGTGAIVRLPQCQWSKPDGYGKISQCITTTKHSKAVTVCIFLGIYCIYAALGEMSWSQWVLWSTPHRAVEGRTIAFHKLILLANCDWHDVKLISSYLVVLSAASKSCEKMFGKLKILMQCISGIRGSQKSTKLVWSVWLTLLKLGRYQDEFTMRGYPNLPLTHWPLGDFNLILGR